MKKLDDIDFKFLRPLVTELVDFNKPEVAEYLGVNLDAVDDESVEQGHYMLDIMDILDDLGDDMNALFTITPYKHEGQWVFDDESRELDKEPFVAGIDDILDTVANGATKLTVIFSSAPFPGASLTLTRLREEMDGNWYQCEELGMEGWLCPAMFKYFTSAPDKIYVQFKHTT